MPVYYTDIQTQTYFIAQKGTKCVHDSEIAIIRAWQQGDEHAVRTVFNRYYPRAVHIAELSGMTLDAAQDCAQEAFVCAFQKRHQLLEPGSFPLWFHRIATRYVLNAIETRHRNKEVSLEATLQITEYPASSVQSEPEDIAISTEEREQLWHRVQALPTNYRLPLALRYYGNFSVPEVAELIGKRESTVRVLLHRALRQLRLLSEAEEHSSPKESHFIGKTDYSIRSSQ